MEYKYRRRVQIKCWKRRNSFVRYVRHVRCSLHRIGRTLCRLWFESMRSEARGARRELSYTHVDEWFLRRWRWCWWWGTGITIQIIIRNLMRNKQTCSAFIIKNRFRYIFIIIKTFVGRASARNGQRTRSRIERRVKQNEVFFFLSIFFCFFSLKYNKRFLLYNSGRLPVMMNCLLPSAIYLFSVVSIIRII